MTSIYQALNRYPDALYCALYPTMIDPATCSAADFNGASALVAGDRVLIQAGAHVGVYLVASNRTSLIADSHFEIWEGMRIRCIRSAGAPAFRQTASAAPAVFAFDTQMSTATDIGLVPGTTAAAGGIKMNSDIGPIQKRVTYWSTAVGASISSLAFNAFLPREITVFHGGDLNVTYWDGTSEIIKSIPDGKVFVDACWMSISSASSTAYNISFGW